MSLMQRLSEPQQRIHSRRVWLILLGILIVSSVGNARLGSRLVNLTRAMRDRQQKSKQNVQLEGSSLGAVLGVMDSAESLDESSGEIVGQEYKYTKDRATYIPEDIREHVSRYPFSKRDLSYST